MAEKTKETKEEKIELEREYIVPMRREFIKVQQYKRARRAVRTIKEFLARHMKVEDRDIRKVKIDKILNEEMWHRGIKNPLHKIKVKAVKKNGIVYAELAEIPEVVKFKLQKLEKRKQGVQKTEIKHDKKNDHIEESEKIETPEKQTEETEKDKAVAETGIKENKAEAKAQKHTTSATHEKKTQPRRQVLKK